jgi:hypothetical protein
MRYVVNVFMAPGGEYDVGSHKVKCIEVKVDEGLLGLKLTENKCRYFPLAQVREFTVEGIDE